MTVLRTKLLHPYSDFIIIIKIRHTLILSLLYSEFLFAHEKQPGKSESNFEKDFVDKTWTLTALASVK